MPSFLGRYFGVSFRTERLIMNIIGLVNSTLDWHPLKWTNKLEQIWNLSLSQQTIILETIGEERIKSVLSYIVIARILIAHVFTLSYMTNFYPIITWSRPNLLLPWLALSFFKNVVLEVIVIAVGLLFWYDKRFSLPIFLEFVFVKVVPLLFATYNWYSNSCLYLELRRIEKMRKLRRNMRSDSNLMVSRLYLKLAETRYRTRSMTTLISWESYDTNDTNDTISRIIEDSSLSPGEKVMKILRLSEQDVEDARNRVREREMHRRLTEDDDETFMTSPRNISRYFSIVSQYDLGTKTLFSPRDQFRKDQAEREKKNRDDSTNKAGIDERTKKEVAENLEEKDRNIILDNSSPSSETSNPKAEAPGTSKNNWQNDPKETIKATVRNLPTEPEILPKTASKETNPEPTEAAELLREKQTQQTNQEPSNPNSKPSHSASTEESSKVDDLADLKSNKNDEKSSTKLQQFFNCNCIGDDSLFKGKLDECSLFDEVAMGTSTPKSSPEKQKEWRNIQETFEDTKSSSNDRVDIDELIDLQIVDDGFLVEKLLRNDLDILKSIKVDEERLASKSKGDVLVEAVNKVADGPSKLYRGEERVDLEKLSKIVKDFSMARGMADNLDILETVEAGECFGRAKIETEVQGSALASVECAVSDGANFVQRSTLNPYNQSIDRDFLNIHLPEYSFGDANIPTFYKDSMKIFDGCYEKDFANNSELQCLLKQLEKKQWSLFHGQAGHEFLLPSNFLIENDRIVVQDLRTAYHLANDFDNFERQDVSLSRPTQDRGIPQILPSTKETQDPSSNPPPKLDVSTQTTFETRTRTTSSSLVDAKKRRRSSLKRKRPKEDAKNHSAASSSINSNRSRRTESQSSLQNARVSPRQKASRTLESHRKPSRLAKSSSSKSVCECKMPQVDSKRSTEWKFEGRSRCKVENFGTVPLSQVAKPSLFDSLIYGRKPPVYPKKVRQESSTQSSSAASSTKKVTASIRKLLEVSRKATEKQTAHSSRKFKWKGRVESLEEQEAKEMRALKVYNEITLLKDKKELEKRTPSGRASTNDGSANWKSKGESKKKRSKVDSPRIRADEDYLGKENSCVDATTETEPLMDVGSKGRATLARNKIASLSSEKYPCAKLTKVNRITDRLLDNFDRLHGGQQRLDSRKNRQSVETDTRKQYSKYSRPKKFLEEENVSISSFKKVEGTQLGRELERVRARKDVRNRVETSGTTFNEDGPRRLSGRDLERLDYCYGTPSTSVGGIRLEGKDGNSFMTIKSTVMLDVVASWSSSTVDQGEEIQLPEQGNPSIPNDGPESLPKIHTEIIKEEPPLPKTFSNETLSTSSTEFLATAEGTTLQLPPRSPEEPCLGTPEASLQLLSPSPAKSSTDFARDVEVSRAYNTVVLSNPSAPKEEKPQRRNIVDDDTIRMIHHAFSDRSIDFILDLSGEILSVNNVLNSGQLRIDSEEFTFQPNRETMGIPMEELAPLPHEQLSFRRQILATICRFENAEQDVLEVGSCPIASPIGSVMDETDEFDEDEEIYPVGSHDLEINEVLSSVIGFLRCLNAEEFSFGSVSDLGQEILQDMSEEDELEFDEEDEEDEDETGKQSVAVERFLRFVQEDVCTDIRFPILVDWADLPGTLHVPNDVREELDINLGQMEPSKVNLFCLEDAEEFIVAEGTSEEDYGKGETRSDLEEDSNAMQQLALETIFSDPFAKLEDLGDNVGILEDPSMEETTLDHRLMEYVDDRREISSGMEELPKNVSEDKLNRTYDLSRDPEEGYEEEECADVLDVDAEEDPRGFVEENSWWRMEEVARKMESFRNEETVEIRSSGNQQSMEEERDLLRDPEGNDEEPALPLISVDEERRSELDRRITLTIILTFWVAVFYFYLRYFYEKIFSFGQVSRSQVSLKPFEIHAVPTSTTTLLEIARLGRRIEGETEENEDETDLLETIVDLETVEHLSSSGSTFNFDSTAASSVSQSEDGTLATLKKRRFNGIENQVEETMLFLSERVTENVRILPFFPSEESVENEEEELAIVDPKTLPSSRAGSQLIRRSFVLQKGEQPELCLAEREVEALQNSMAKTSDTELGLEEAEEISVASDEMLSDVSREETSSFNSSTTAARRQRPLHASEEEETVRNEGRDDCVKMESLGRDCEEQREILEEKMASSLSQIPNVYSPSTDSFDSNYTGISESSKSISAGDLNASSMEEFADFRHTVPPRRSFLLTYLPSSFVISIERKTRRDRLANGTKRRGAERRRSALYWSATGVGVRVVGVRFAVCRDGALFLAQFLTIFYRERIALDPKCDFHAILLFSTTVFSRVYRSSIASFVRFAQQPLRAPVRRRTSRAYTDYSNNAAVVVLQVLFPKNGDAFHRSIGNNPVDPFVDPDLHPQRRMENDIDRCGGPEYRQNNFRNKSLHDHSNLDVAHNWRN